MLNLSPWICLRVAWNTGSSFIGQHCRCTPTSPRTFSTAIRQWAAQNPTLARQVLTPPTVSNASSLSNDGNLQSTLLNCGDSVSLELYLQKRNWNIPFDSDKHSFYEEAIGLVTYPLTFPLTLAHYGTRTLLNHPDNEEGCDETSRQNLYQGDICCVGARAEATLPEPFWRELLIATLPYVQNWKISFIGPEVPKGLRPKRIYLCADSKEENESNCFLDLTFHNGYFHDVLLASYQNRAGEFDNAKLVSRLWDGIVLFNPGIGHPYLKAGWESTIRLLIRSGVYLFFTAHHEIDRDRDLSTIRTYMKEEGFEESTVSSKLEYVRNPWASRMEVEDPLNRAQIVKANEYVLVIPARKMCD